MLYRFRAISIHAAGFFRGMPIHDRTPASPSRNIRKPGALAGMAACRKCRDLSHSPAEITANMPPEWGT